MRYCPRCRAEYQDWEKKCLDCSVKLADTLPAEASDPRPEDDAADVKDENTKGLVVVASYEQPLEASINRSILESEGIMSIITDRPMDILNLMDGGAPNDIKLMVRKADAAAAREILDSIVKDVAGEDFPEGEFPDGEDPGK
jgi:hypothetical protein